MKFYCIGNRKIIEILKIRKKNTLLDSKTRKKHYNILYRGTKKYLENKLERSKKNRELRKKNIEKHLRLDKKYREKNREKINKCANKFYHKNKERILKKMAEKRNTTGNKKNSEKTKRRREMFDEFKNGETIQKLAEKEGVTRQALSLYFIRNF